MNKLLLVHRSQTGSDLRRDFQRELYLQRTRAFDETLERFPLDKLHRVKAVLTGSRHALAGVRKALACFV